jgi:hypothetical protein
VVLALVLDPFVLTNPIERINLPPLRPRRHSSKYRLHQPRIEQIPGEELEVGEMEMVPLNADLVLQVEIVHVIESFGIVPYLNLSRHP